MSNSKSKRNKPNSDPNISDDKSFDVKMNSEILTDTETKPFDKFVRSSQIIDNPNPLLQNNYLEVN